MPAAAARCRLQVCQHPSSSAVADQRPRAGHPRPSLSAVALAAHWPGPSPLLQPRPSRAAGRSSVLLVPLTRTSDCAQLPQPRALTFGACARQPHPPWQWQGQHLLSRPAAAAAAAVAVAAVEVVPGLGVPAAKGEGNTTQMVAAAGAPAGLATAVAAAAAMAAAAAAAVAACVPACLRDCCGGRARESATCHRLHRWQHRKRWSRPQQLPAVKL